MRDNKISKIKASLSETSNQQIGRTLSRVTSWAKKEIPQILFKLMPEYRFEYSGENGQIWIKLLEEWNKSAAAN